MNKLTTTNYVLAGIIFSGELMNIFFTLSIILAVLTGCASTQYVSGISHSGNMTFVRDTGTFNGGGAPIFVMLETSDKQLQTDAVCFGEPRIRGDREKNISTRYPYLEFPQLDPYLWKLDYNAYLMVLDVTRFQALKPKVCRAAPDDSTKLVFVGTLGDKGVELPSDGKIIDTCGDGLYAGRAIGLLGPDGQLTTDIPPGKYNIRAWGLNPLPGGGFGLMSVPEPLTVDQSTPYKVTFTYIYGRLYLKGESPMLADGIYPSQPFGGAAARLGTSIERR